MIQEILFDTVPLKDAMGDIKVVATAISAVGLALSRVLGKITDTTQIVRRDTRKTLADFDKLQKLGSWQTGTVITETVREEITGMEQVADKILSSMGGSVENFAATVLSALKELTGWDGGKIAGRLASVLSAAAAVNAILSGNLSMALWLSTVSMGLAATGKEADNFMDLITKVQKAFSGFGNMSGSLPSWLQGIVGTQFGLTTPSIPFLAEGAVLPANKPFLAMVGDQRHGTNIEAPLSTIQEAVGLTMEEHTNAVLAGLEASVGIQREILEAVLGIRIGDETIARAGERYYRKMALAGGCL